MNRFHMAFFAAAAAICFACTPTPDSTTTPPVTETPRPGLCGGPVPRLEIDPVFAISSDYDSYIWVLPDGSDAGISADQLRAADPDSDRSTVIRMPAWGRPAISPDHKRAAVIVQRRYSGEPQHHYLLVISTESEPVSAMFEFPENWTQPLFTLTWLEKTGCLAALGFNVPDGDVLYLINESGEVFIDIYPHLARGDVLEGAGMGWIVIDRTRWGGLAEMELFDINDPDNGILVQADETLPALPGLLGGGKLTAAELAVRLRN